MTHAVVLHESGAIDVAELQTLAAMGLLLWRARERGGSQVVMRYTLLDVKPTEREALDAAAEFRKEQRDGRKKAQESQKSGDEK